MFKCVPFCCSDIPSTAYSIGQSEAQGASMNGLAGQHDVIGANHLSGPSGSMRLLELRWRQGVLASPENQRYSRFAVTAFRRRALFAPSIRLTFGQTTEAVANVDLMVAEDLDGISN